MARKATRKTTKKAAKRKPAAKKRAVRKTASRKKASAKKTTRKKAAPKRKGAAKKKAAAKKKTAKKKTAKKTAQKAAPKPAAKPPVKKIRTATKPKNRSTLAYTQSEFVENVRGFCGLEKRAEAKELCEDLAAFITDSLKKGYKLPLLGLGKIYVRQTKARMGRNPATGETIHIPARKRVRFSPAKSLKEAVL